MDKGDLITIRNTIIEVLTALFTYLQKALGDFWAGEAK